MRREGREGVARKGRGKEREARREKEKKIKRRLGIKMEGWEGKGGERKGERKGKRTI